MIETAVDLSVCISICDIQEATKKRCAPAGAKGIHHQGMAAQNRRHGLQKHWLIGHELAMIDGCQYRY